MIYIYIYIYLDRAKKKEKNRTDNAVLTLSVGVTTVILSTAPATIPARIPRLAESFPRSSEREFLIVSNERNRTAALAVVPCVGFVRTVSS